MISQLTWISGANLCIWIIFHEKDRNRKENLKTLACGLILGTSIYTYSTARLLTFLMLISLWIIYFKRDNIRKLALITSSFFISLVPYILFTINNPGATTGRFSSISYIDDSMPLITKSLTFLHNLLAYWSPDFLIIHGDTNLRHSTGLWGNYFYCNLAAFFDRLGQYYIQ